MDARVSAPEVLNGDASRAAQRLDECVAALSTTMDCCEQQIAATTSSSSPMLRNTGRKRSAHRDRLPVCVDPNCSFWQRAGQIEQQQQQQQFASASPETPTPPPPLASHTGSQPSGLGGAGGANAPASPSSSPLALANTRLAFARRNSSAVSGVLMAAGPTPAGARSPISLGQLAGSGQQQRCASESGTPLAGEPPAAAAAAGSGDAAAAAAASSSPLWLASQSRAGARGSIASSVGGGVAISVTGTSEEDDEDDFVSCANCGEVAAAAAAGGCSKHEPGKQRPVSAEPSASPPSSSQSGPSRSASATPTPGDQADEPAAGVSPQPSVKQRARKPIKQRATVSAQSAQGRKISAAAANIAALSRPARHQSVNERPAHLHLIVGGSVSQLSTCSSESSGGHSSAVSPTTTAATTALAGSARAAPGAGLASKRGLGSHSPSRFNFGG